MRRGTKQRMLIGEFNEFHLESLREACYTAESAQDVGSRSNLNGIDPFRSAEPRKLLLR